MSVRSKSLLVIALAMAGLTASLYFVLSYIIGNDFDRLEQRQVQTDVERVRDSVEQGLRTLESKAGDWGTWDDTYRYIEDRNAEYEQSNLTSDALGVLEINMIAFVHRSGEIVRTICYDLDGGEEMALPEGIALHLAAGSPLLAITDPGGKVSGIVMIPRGPLLVASRPIVTSQGQGPIRGTLVFGRFLDAAEIEHINSLTHIESEFSRIDRGALPPDMDVARTAIGGSKRIFVKPLSGRQTAGYAVLEDLYGQPALVLKTTVQRDIHASGKHSTNLLLVALLVVGLVSLGTMMLLLEGTVISRLTRLSKAVTSIGEKRDFGTRLPVLGKDEMSGLARNVNLMLDRLEFLSNHDPLTGLYNRKQFEEATAQANEGPIGLVVCDVDGLKLVNDTLGHVSGDALLRAAAHVLSLAAGDGRMAARIGGDEFAIIVRGEGESGTSALAGRICLEIEAHNAARQDPPLSLSTGWAAVESGPVDMKSLYVKADNHMFSVKMNQSRSARSDIVEAFMRVMSERDSYVEQHSRRLFSLMKGLAKAEGYPETKLADMELLAKFHDIGKMGIPDSVLAKAGPLGEDEIAIMRMHPEIGARIASSAPQLGHIADLILHHHERWDGKGYPAGLRGHEIPIECRILALAETFDDITNDSRYRGARSEDEALVEIERCAGTQFDPQLVEVFVRLARNQV